VYYPIHDFFFATEVIGSPYHKMTLDHFSPADELATPVREFPINIGLGTEFPGRF
jgi:hypothetical protein